MSADRIWELIARKLADEISAEELQELEQLLRNHPNLHLPVQTITDLWQQGLKEKDDLGLEAAYTKHLQRMQELGIEFPPSGITTDAATAYLLEGRRKPSTKKIWAWTAGIASASAAIWLIFFLPNNNTSAPSGTTAGILAPVSEISTRYGSKSKVQLPDGSSVWLNAGSTITYGKQYGNGLREVNLTGEAFFDVVRNPEVPFIIHTTRMDIKVLGTKFNVKSYPGESSTEAALIHGSIEVLLKNRPAEKIILKPSEKIVVADSPPSTDTRTSNSAPNEPLVAIKHLTYEPNDSTVVETSWLDNKLIFRDESFASLAQQMERWFGVTIHFNNKELERLRFTGNFHNETIQQALDALKWTAKFSYSIEGKEITISR